MKTGYKSYSELTHLKNYRKVHGGIDKEFSRGAIRKPVSNQVNLENIDVCTLTIDDIYILTENGKIPLASEALKKIGENNPTLLSELGYCVDSDGDIHKKELALQVINFCNLTKSQIEKLTKEEFINIINLKDESSKIDEQVLSVLLKYNKNILQQLGYVERMTYGQLNIYRPKSPSK